VFIMSKAETTIEVRDLTKYYGDFQALRGISFDVHRGEIVGFLGPNGAGKSTTMKILTCYMAATTGTAKVMNIDVTQDSIGVRARIGYLPESVPLYDQMVVFDYLDHLAELRGVPSSKREAAVTHAVEVCGLGPVVAKKIDELSKGYRQRVGLAQALVHSPDVLILDEPTSGLDPNQIVDIRELIRSIGKEKTVLLSTHILQEIEALCDRVILINGGTVVADGNFDELYAAYPAAERNLEKLFRLLTASTGAPKAVAPKAAPADAGKYLPPESSAAPSTESSES
jgi:ABC-2 type transport system ATP-binding protein